jgi:imidazole glycerol-phosphate synthase subunit HisF
VRPRLIPVLLLDRNRRLVKTVQFGERTYIGDPFNVVRLFNEKEVDEIVILDIDATVDGRKADTGFIAELASECFMPLSFGGGLVSMDQCAPLARAGVEKFILGSSIADHNFVSDMTSSFGGQAVVACIDYRQKPSDEVYCRSGKKGLSVPVVDYAKSVEAMGVGEILLQSIEEDGMRCGMDLSTIQRVSAATTIPVVAAGGAGEISHLGAALNAGASAAASGSAFSFIGRLRAVLITYPEGDVIQGFTQ